MKQVLVTWIDATSQDAWGETRDVRDLTCSRIRTLGFLLDESPERIVLAASWDETGAAVAQSVAIPCVLIESILHFPISQ